MPLPTWNEPQDFTSWAHLHKQIHHSRMQAAQSRTLHQLDFICILCSQIIDRATVHIQMEWESGHTSRAILSVIQRLIRASQVAVLLRAAISWQCSNHNMKHHLVEKKGRGSKPSRKLEYCTSINLEFTRYAFGRDVRTAGAMKSNLLSSASSISGDDSRFNAICSGHWCKLTPVLRIHSKQRPNWEIFIAHFVAWCRRRIWLSCRN